MFYYESVDGQFIFTDEMRKATGRRIRKLREARGLSISEVIDVAGIKSKATISRIENGQGVLDISVLFSLAHLFEVPFSYLVCGTGFDFPQLTGEDAMDEKEAKKKLFLEELSYDIGLLDKKTQRKLRRFVDKKLGLKEEKPDEA